MYRCMSETLWVWFQTTTIKVSLMNFLLSQVYESYTIVILSSIKCAITLGLKKQYPYLNLKCLLLKMLTIT